MLTFDSTMISNMIFYAVVFLVWRFIRNIFHPESTRTGTLAAYGCFIIISWICIFAPVNIIGMNTPREVFFIPLVSIGGFLASFVVTINMFCRLGAAKETEKVARRESASSAPQLGSASAPRLCSTGIGGRTEYRRTEREAARTRSDRAPKANGVADFFSSVKSCAKNAKSGFEKTVLPREEKYSYRKVGRDNGYAPIDND